MRRPFNLTSLKPMSSELEAIKGLLLHEWDPIGVSEFAEASDEYDAYALQVYKMVREHADADAIARYLNWVVTSQMWLPGNLDHNRAIAIKVLAIHKLGHR